MTWRVRIGDQEYSTGNLDELREWHRTGRIPEDAYVYHPVLERWLYPSEVRELRSQQEAASPTGPVPPAESGTVEKKPNDPATLGCFVAIVLGILFVAAANVSYLLVIVLTLATIAATVVLGKKNRETEQDFSLLIVVLLIASVAGVLLSSGGASNAYKEWQEQRQARAEQEAAEAAEAERLAGLRESKQENLERGRQLLEEDSPQEALAAFALVAKVDESYRDLPELMATAQEMANAQREQELLAEIEDTPNHRFYSFIRIYKELVNLKPDNERYQERLDHYQAFAREQESIQEGQRAREQMRARAKLQLLNLNYTTTGRYAKVEGQVKNVSGESLKNVEAVATFTTSDGTFVTTDSALIEYNPILPGQTSPFSITARDNPQMQSVSINFKHLMGGTIPYYRDE